MTQIIAGLLKAFDTRGNTLVVLWCNMMLMAVASIACPYIGIYWGDPYTVMLVWSWIWGIGAVICGIAFFCLLVFVQ